MKFHLIAVFLLSAVLLAACGGSSNTADTNEANAASPAESPADTTETAKDSDESGSAAIASPTAAIETFIEGVRAKDEKMMRSALSEATIERFESMMKEQNKSFYEVVVGEDYESMSKMPEMRNEKIDGEKATLEIRDENTEEFDPIPFVKQNGSWKIALFDNAPEEPM